MKWQETNNNGRHTDARNYRGNEGVSSILFDSAYGLSSSDHGNNFDPQKIPRRNRTVEGRTEDIEPINRESKSESEGKSKEKTLEIKKRTEHWASLLEQARKDPDLYDTAAKKVAREMASLSEDERSTAVKTLNNELSKKGMADRVGISAGSVEDKNVMLGPDQIYFVRSDGTVVKKTISAK